jgi:ABC-type multidrug transport system ATPase subunit
MCPLQAVVQQALSRLMAGRTVLVIAHRLSTIRDANRICVISNGQLAEQGSHDDLICAKGLYAGLIARQIDNGGSNGSSDVEGGQALSIGSFGSHAAGGSMSDLSDGARQSLQGTSGRGSMGSSRSSTGQERSSIEAAAAEAVAAVARGSAGGTAGDGKSQQ